ncbi:MAG TPA: AMP-binding protein [Bacteroidales bacterium]|nr:AMP-binding protein [Bacteroidales bacterium]
MFNHILNSFNKYPDKNAFNIKDHYYTYKELEKYTSIITKKIIEKIPNENLIGVIANDDIFTYSTLLAIILNGKAYLPINPMYPPSRNANIIKQANIKSIISSIEKEKTIAIIGENHLNIYCTNCLYNNEVTYTNVIFKDQNCFDDNSLVYVLFTSGSTGTPKGVPITRKNLFTFFDAFLDIGYNFTSEDRFLQMFDLNFDLSVVSYLTPLMNGACVYTVNPSLGIKYTEIYKILENHNITFALMVPSILNGLKPYFEDISLQNLKYSLFCGEALKKDIIEQWQKCVPNALIQNTYGPTEGTITCFNYNCIMGNIKAHNGIVSIGKPMKNTTAVIIDKNNNLTNNYTKGELCISGPHITKGYLNNSENDKAFIKLKINGETNIFYKTGDICFKDAEDDFMFCGRTDQQIKIQGYRIELSEIEHQARMFSNGAEVVAVTRNNKQGNTEIVLFIESKTDCIREIYTKMYNTLPNYMIPSEIKLIESLPYNSNGKINRKKLSEIALK